MEWVNSTRAGCRRGGGGGGLDNKDLKSRTLQVQLVLMVLSAQENTCDLQIWVHVVMCVARSTPSI